MGPSEAPSIAPALARFMDDTSAVSSYGARVGSDVALDVLSAVFEAPLHNSTGFDPRAGPNGPWLLGSATNLLRAHAGVPTSAALPSLGDGRAYARACRVIRC